MIDRDSPPTTSDPEEAFTSWERSGVTQARQPHSFWARSRNLLQERAPEVLDRLLAIGVGEWNVLDIAPAELRVPEDRQFTSLLVRRLPFELTLRQIVEQEPLVTIRSETMVEDLVLDEESAGPAAVRGVRLRGGEVVEADFVIDASGRRTRIPRLLEDRGVTWPMESEDCRQIYYGRYYRQHEGSDLERDSLLRNGGANLGYLEYGTFLGDNGTLGFFFGPPSWDQELKVMRHGDAWEAAGRAIPAIAPWLEPEHSEAISDVQAMAGHRNELRQILVGGEPAVLGMLPIGDALCTTNPANGWGASLALTHAFAAVDAINDAGPDRRQIALAFDAAVGEETATYYRVASAQDRVRNYRWRGEDIPEHDREAAERQELLEYGLNPAMRRDMHVLRAMMRRLTMVDDPDAIWSDEQSLSVAREVAEWRKANRPSSALGPPREELLEIMEATRG